MDGVRAAVRVAVGLSLLLLGVAIAIAVQERTRPPAVALQEPGGDSFPVPTAIGEHRALWAHTPVLVIVRDEATWTQLAATHGGAEVSPGVVVPGAPGLRMFAISAKSTWHGCTLTPIQEGGAAGLLLMDPCRQVRWDPFLRGRLVAGPDTVRALPVLNLFVRDGVLHARSFEGDPRSENEMQPGAPALAS